MNDCLPHTQKCKPGDKSVQRAHRSPGAVSPVAEQKSGDLGRIKICTAIKINLKNFVFMKIGMFLNRSHH